MAAEGHLLTVSQERRPNLFTAAIPVQEPAGLTVMVMIQGMFNHPAHLLWLQEIHRLWFLVLWLQPMEVIISRMFAHCKVFPIVLYGIIIMTSRPVSKLAYSLFHPKCRKDLCCTKIIQTRSTLLQK